jgi:hypothetical protein
LRAAHGVVKEGEYLVGDRVRTFVGQEARRPLNRFDGEVVRVRLIAAVHLRRHGGIRGAVKHAAGDGEPAVPVRAPSWRAAHLGQD